MYDNKELLRRHARTALESQGYKVESLKYGRLIAIKDGKRSRVMVRTSSDRWIGWMRRRDTGAWNGMEDADLVVTSALDQQREPSKAEVCAYLPEVTKGTFDEHLAARE